MSVKILIGQRCFLLLVGASVAVGLLFMPVARAGISIAPYASISSTKKIKPNPKNKSEEEEVIKQRTTYGIVGSLSFFRVFKLQASAGQNQLTTTQKTQFAADDYGEIDYNKDLTMSTDQPDKEVKTTETQRIGRLGLALDPGFWIFILRAKGGVQATQRLVKLEEKDKPAVSKLTPISYKPFAGAGAGVRLSPSMFFMAEYSIFMYQFPKTAPFEREVTVSYSVSI